MPIYRYENTRTNKVLEGDEYYWYEVAKDFYIRAGHYNSSEYTRKSMPVDWWERIQKVFRLEVVG